MGYTNNAATRAWRGALLAFMLVLGLVAVAQPAKAVELGISDSNAATLHEPLWDGLRLNRARIVVPYDVASTDGAAGIRRRRDFEAYRADAAAKGIGLFVVFGPSVDVRAPDTREPLAPTADEFSAGFAAFLAKYPDVRTIGPWNEPNNPDASQYPLGADPELAATYWLRAEQLCPSGCTLVAGEFAGIAGDDAYIDAYQAALGAATPPVWGFHAHGDVNAFQANGPDSARISRYYLSKLQGQWAGSRIWIDEVGARYRDASGVVWGDASQEQATQFLLGLGTLDPRIDAIYYYNYSNQCSTPGLCAVQDRGLVSPTPFDGQPPDYDAVNRPRAAYNVIANRGPAITPAAPVPPVVTITQPAQSSAVGTSTPTFAGQAAVGGRAVPSVTLQIFPGAASTQGSRAVQTVTAPVAGGAWSTTVARLADGTYTAEASQAGNPTSSGISQDVVFTVDTVAPTSTVTGPPALTGARTATLSMTASETGATFSCKVDRGAFAPCATPLRLRDLAVGKHTLTVRATDAAGNVQRTATRYSWRVVSLATALAPRTGDLGTALAAGLPLATTCSDSCRVGARLYMPATEARALGLVGRGVSRHDPGRPRGKGYVTVGGASTVRTRAGAATLALRLRAASSAAVRRTSSVTLRVGISMIPKGSKPTQVSSRVTLVRSGALRALAAGGLPATVACSSACTQKTALWVPQKVARALRAPGRVVAGSRRTGLPRGSYVSLAAATATRRSGGVSTVTLSVPRAVRTRVARLRTATVRVAGLASGPGTPASAVSWPLVLLR